MLINITQYGWHIYHFLLYVYMHRYPQAPLTAFFFLLKLDMPFLEKVRFDSLCQCLVVICHHFVNIG